MHRLIDKARFNNNKNVYTPGFIAMDKRRYLLACLSMRGHRQ